MAERLSGQQFRYRDEDRDRWVPESPKNSLRTAFERDRARILHSSALRRLGAKTQVVGPSSDDFVRTRLTHSLEVAQVGRELAKNLGCDPDIVDAACLSHDIGHPPFGHNGERALADISQDIGGFEGNAQTFRLLTRLEPKVVTEERGAGVNLTRATLDAACKYPWTQSQIGQARPGSQKFGVYDDDLEVFTWLRDPAMEYRRSIEAQVMDLSDDISYSVHDVEDAVVSGHLQLEVLGTQEARELVVTRTQDWYEPTASHDEILAALDRLREQHYWVEQADGSHRALAALKDMTSQLIGRFCLATLAATRGQFGLEPLIRYSGQLIVPRETELEISVLKGVAAAFVMTQEVRRPLYERQREILTELAGYLLDRAPDVLEKNFADSWQQAANDAGKKRVVIDQLASITDAKAVAWHSTFEDLR